MSITFRELPDGYGVRAEVDLMEEARKRIRRKIEIDGEKALELALAEVGYVKERTCRNTQSDFDSPYGRNMKTWVKKCFDESKRAKVVMLIPARTDTAYFHDYIYGKAHITFIRGRLKFEVGGGCHE